MISSEAFKREGTIILICISLSFVFRLGVSLISEYYQPLVKQLEVDIAEKKRSVGIKIMGDPIKDKLLRQATQLMEQDSRTRGEAVINYNPQAEKKYKIMGKSRRSEWENSIRNAPKFVLDSVPDVPQALNAEFDQELQALINKLEEYRDNIWSREEKDRAQNRLFWGLLLVVYSTRGIKAFVSSGISLEKKMFVFLSIWSFAHIFTYIVTKGDGSYEIFFPFYSFWNTPIGGVYDFTELFFYVGGGWLFFFLYKYLTKDSIN